MTRDSKTIDAWSGMVLAAGDAARLTGTRDARAAVAHVLPAADVPAARDNVVQLFPGAGGDGDGPAPLTQAEAA